MLKRVALYMPQADYDFLASEAQAGRVSMSHYITRLIMMARLTKFGAGAVSVVPLVPPTETIETKPEPIFKPGEWRDRPPEKTEEELRLERIATYKRIASMASARPTPTEPESPRSIDDENADQSNAPADDEG